MAESDAEGLEVGSLNQAPEKCCIRVIVADSEPIFRVGMRKIFALEDDLRIVAQAESCEQAISLAAKFAADILLFETTLSKSPTPVISKILETTPALKVILVAPELNEQQTVEFLRCGVRGIVTRSVSPNLLIKCIRKVYLGETWLDNQGVNWVIDAYRAQAQQLTSPRNRAKISQKEMLIISGVAQGMRNKDIAQEVGTSEQVVKNYLRKIYDKLGVSDRLELALYTMHHHLLDGYRHPDGTVSEQSVSVRPATSVPAERLKVVPE